jgi:hypothetical protein
VADPVLTLAELHGADQPKGFRIAPRLFVRRYSNEWARWSEYWRRLPGPKDESILETKYQLMEVAFGTSQTATGEA